MTPFFPKRTFSRRDIFRALTGRLRQDATPAFPTGLDPLSKAIDHLVATGHYQEALAKLHTLVNKSPDHIQARRKVGYCLFQIGRYAEAEQTFAGILAHHPQDSFTLLHQGLSLVKQDRLSEAIVAWRKYFNTDQPIIQRAVNLQIALFETGGPSESEEVAKHIQEAVAEQQQVDLGK